MFLNSVFHLFSYPIQSSPVLFSFLSSSHFLFGLILSTFSYLFQALPFTTYFTSIISFPCSAPLFSLLLIYHFCTIEFSCHIAFTPSPLSLLYASSLVSPFVRPSSSFLLYFLFCSPLLASVFVKTQYQYINPFLYSLLSSLFSCFFFSLFLPRNTSPSLLYGPSLSSLVFIFSLFCLL